MPDKDELDFINLIMSDNKIIIDSKDVA